MKNYFLNRAEEREKEEKQKEKETKEKTEYPQIYGWKTPERHTNMGIGKVGETSCIKRKFRWGCKALDDTGKVLFEGFVKVSSRPNFEFEETEIVINNQKAWIPGKKMEWEEMTFTVLDCDPDNFDVTNTKNIELTLYDGCANALERWDLKDVKKMSLVWDSIDETSVEWTVTYDNCHYNKCEVRAILPPWNTENYTI